MTAFSPIVFADAIEWQEAPAPPNERWPAALSAALHAGVIAAALIVLHSEPQTLDLAGSAIEVELIAETISSGADAAESDAAVDIVSAGGEAVKPMASEPAKAIEAIETESVEPKALEAPVEAAEPVLVAPTATLATKALQPVDAAAPVPHPRTSKQRPAEKPPAQAAPKKPQQTGNGGNRHADAKARAPAGGPKATRQPGNGAAVTKYPGQVLAELRRALRYPRGGRGVGEVSVQFTISAGGAASGLRVVKSSGNPVFDRAALETVRRAAPFPPIPPQAGRNSWTFTMPLGFVR